MPNKGLTLEFPIASSKCFSAVWVLPIPVFSYTKTDMRRHKAIYFSIMFTNQLRVLVASWICFQCSNNYPIQKYISSSILWLLLLFSQAYKKSRSHRWSLIIIINLLLAQEKWIVKLITMSVNCFVSKIIIDLIIVKKITLDVLLHIVYSYII